MSCGDGYVRFKDFRYDDGPKESGYYNELLAGNPKNMKSFVLDDPEIALRIFYAFQGHEEGKQLGRIFVETYWPQDSDNHEAAFHVAQALGVQIERKPHVMRGTDAGNSGDFFGNSVDNRVV